MNITKYFQDKEIKFHDTDDERLVCAKDLLAAIGYKNPKSDWTYIKPKVEKLSNMGVGKFATWYPNLNRSYDTDFLNEEQAYIVLFTSQLTSTLEFRKWVISLIKREVRSVFNSIVGTEEDLANQLTFLTSLSRLNFTFECSVEDTISAPHASGLNRTKRYDFVRRLPNVTQIYELKRGELTAAHVYQTLLVKHYMELGSTIGAKRVDFVFIAESISDEAVAAIKMFRCEDKYDAFDHNGFTFKGRIRFMSLNEFSTDIYKGIIEKTPESGAWYIHQHILRYTPSLFNDIQIQGFKKSVFKEPKRLQLMEAA